MGGEIIKRERERENRGNHRRERNGWMDGHARERERGSDR